MSAIINTIRGIGTVIYNAVCSGFSIISNLFHRIFPRGTTPHQPADLSDRVKITSQTPLLDEKTERVQKRHFTHSKPPQEPPKIQGSSSKESHPPSSLKRNEDLPFRMVDVPKDGNCFFHTLKGGLTHLNHSMKDKSHQELRACMIEQIDQTHFDLSSTLLGEITDYRERVRSDFSSYQAMVKIAPNQKIDKRALIQSIINHLPAYVHALFVALQINSFQTTSITKTYLELLSKLEMAGNCLTEPNFNQAERFKPVVQAYLGAISEPCALVSLPAAEPLANLLGVEIVLHVDQAPLFSQLSSVGPSGKSIIHMVQTGNHFNLLIPN